MSTWECIADDDLQDLVAARGPPAPRFSPQWRTVAAAVATFAALLLVVAWLPTAGLTPPGPVATGGFVNLAAAETCDPTADCNGCADEAACVECAKKRDCADCDKGGNCAACYKAALLTCCEKAKGGKRNRQECCQRDDLKGTTPLCNKTCAENYGDCGAWQCCQTAGFKCYTKHDWYAQCRPGCAKTKVEIGVEWECKQLPASGEGVAEPLQCSAAGENCRESRCCQDQDMSCYEKNRWWSSCRTTGTCTPGLWEVEKGFDWEGPWNCSLDEPVKEDDPKAKCQTNKVTRSDRRRSAQKPVDACEQLGTGWKPVESKQKCQDLSTTEQPVKAMLEDEDTRYKLSGCSFDTAQKQFTWNSEPASIKKCSAAQACVCQKCEPLAPS